MQLCEGPAQGSYAGTVSHLCTPCCYKALIPSSNCVIGRVYYYYHYWSFI